MYSSVILAARAVAVRARPPPDVSVCLTRHLSRRWNGIKWNEMVSPVRTCPNLSEQSEPSMNCRMYQVVLANLSAGTLVKIKKVAYQPKMALLNFRPHQQKTLLNQLSIFLLAAAKLIRIHLFRLLSTAGNGRPKRPSRKFLRTCTSICVPTQKMVAMPKQASLMLTVHMLVVLS